MTATLADRSGLSLYGRVPLEGRIRNSSFAIEFLVSRISDNGILGIPFLTGQKFALYLDKGVPPWRGDTIPLADKDGKLLASKIYHPAIWSGGTGLL